MILQKDTINRLLEQPKNSLLSKECWALYKIGMRRTLADDRSIHHVINERAWQKYELPDILKEYTYNGRVYLMVTSTDCDHTRATYKRSIEPTVEAYVEFFDHLYDDAEGPTSARLLHPEDVCEFEPSQRDLALEAFEDGHPHCVSEVRFDEEGDYHV